MAQARRALAKALPSEDVVIEVLDARMPYASSNPIVTALRKQKPCIKVLSKADLADPEVTDAWVKYLTAEGESRHVSRHSGQVVVITSSEDRFARLRTRIPELCQRLVGRTASVLRPIRAIVVGIPNVGKSTIINVLLGRKVAKTGDEPAVTKTRQRVELPGGIQVSDNPGLLWPKITDERVGYRLAFGGAISEAALDYVTVARFGGALLLERYPEQLCARYKLKAIPASSDELLLEIGRRRGCLRSGNVVDLHKAADVLIHDFRGGIIGRVSLERPQDLTIAAHESTAGELQGAEGAEGAETADEPGDGDSG
jgi:ribosome biogenesis GTPase A